MPDGAVPQLQEVELDPAGLRQLFDDLAACAAIEHVQARAREDDRVVDRQATLREARDLVEGGRASMVQIRYRYQGEAWCDTLLVRDGCVRLVRSQPALSVGHGSDTCDRE